jgi:hypothetical protein
MKILHILNDGPSELSDKIIDAQLKENEVKVVPLQKRDVSYEELVDEIFSSDRVVSW